MKRFIVVVGKSTDKQQNAITKVISEAGVAWWHHLPTLWLIADKKDRDAGSWLEEIREAAPGASVVIFDADGQNIPTGFMKTTAVPWLKKVWNRRAAAVEPFSVDDDDD